MIFIYLPFPNSIMANANERTSPAHEDRTPWTAEPDGHGFYRVVNADAVVIAAKCVHEEATLFAAAPLLRDACLAALSQLTDDRDEYRDEDIRQLQDALAAAGCPRKRYRVVLRQSISREAFVDAFCEEEATEIAGELGPDAFAQVQDELTGWTAVRVEQVSQEQRHDQ